MALVWEEIDPAAWHTELDHSAEDPAPFALWKAAGVFVGSKGNRQGFAMYVFRAQPESDYDSISLIENRGVWHAGNVYCGVSDYANPPKTLDGAKERAWRRLRVMGHSSFNVTLPEHP